MCSATISTFSGPNVINYTDAEDTAPISTTKKWYSYIDRKSSNLKKVAVYLGINLCQSRSS
jgi:hypothetical protein